MCGRYALRNTGQLPEIFEVSDLRLPPRFNIAPTRDVAVVRADAQGKRVLELMRWGLVPSWAKDRSIGARMINARCETAARKPSFRVAFRRRRCLIPADGFYEWKKEKDGKRPVFVRLRGDRPFAMAGLWEEWEGGDEKPLRSCAILTCPANRLLEPIHERMPVILPPEGYRLWLSGDTPSEEISTLLAPYPPNEMECFPVSRRVNNPAFDDPACLTLISHTVSCEK